MSALPPVSPLRAKSATLLRGTSHAFSLIELLAVIGIVALLAVAVGPVITGIMSGQGLSSAAYGISDTLGHARAYAVAHNTYVWVGIDEVDQAVSPSASPQTDGVGRVALSVIASRDGTRIYDPGGDISSDWTAKTADGSRLSQISKLLRFDHVHLDGSLEPGASGGGMERPPVESEYRVSMSAPPSAVTFRYPLPAATGSARHTFEHVIEFDPQGSARLFVGGGLKLARQIEVGMRPTKGNTLVAGEVNQAAVQVDGLTGATAIYRP